MTNVVTRRERAAARLRRELDRKAGRATDPRIEAIANAKPAIVRVTDRADIPAKP